MAGFGTSGPSGKGITLRQVWPLSADVDERILPGKGQPGRVACIAASSSFVVFGTEEGKVCFFCPEVRVVACTHRGGESVLLPPEESKHVVCYVIHLTCCFVVLAPGPFSPLCCARSSPSASLRKQAFRSSRTSKSVQTGIMADEYVHGKAIRRVWPNMSGTKVRGHQGQHRVKNSLQICPVSSHASARIFPRSSQASHALCFHPSLRP